MTDRVVPTEPRYDQAYVYGLQRDLSRARTSYWVLVALTVALSLFFCGVIAGRDDEAASEHLRAEQAWQRLREANEQLHDAEDALDRCVSLNGAFIPVPRITGTTAAATALDP